MRLLRVAKNNSEFRDFLLTCGPQTLSFPYTSNYKDDRFLMEMDFQRPITAGAAAYCYHEIHWKFRVFSIDLWASNFIVSDMYGSYLLGPHLLLEKNLANHIYLSGCIVETILALRISSWLLCNPINYLGLFLSFLGLSLQSYVVNTLPEMVLRGSLTYAYTAHVQVDSLSSVYIKLLTQNRV